MAEVHPDITIMVDWALKKPIINQSTGNSENVCALFLPTFNFMEHPTD